MSLPDPVIIEHEGILVVRDDLLPGGTKRRVLSVLFDEHEEYVYASPVYGYAQVALAITARDHGKRATIFCAKRQQRYFRTTQAEVLGATIHEVPHGYLTVVKAKARAYCEQTGAKLMPFGLDDERVINALAEVAQRLPVEPTEVWSVCGSGVLTRALQRAWPAAKVYGVQVGMKPDAGRAQVFLAPEKFDQGAEQPPPFPSTHNYDAKAWRFIKTHAAPGALFWNVQ